MKLSKQQTKLHQQACDMVHSDHNLSIDDREFIVRNWNPQANHNVGVHAVFFTPLDLACDMMIETLNEDEKDVIDLGAGIGTLGFAMECRRGVGKKGLDLTCIEINPSFVEVGKRVLPYAQWVQMDVTEWIKTFSGDLLWGEAISNPPYGNQGGKANIELRFAEIAMQVAKIGTFLLPAGKHTNWKYSGEQTFREFKNPDYEKWSEKTGIALRPNCGIDCFVHKDSWSGTKMLVDIVNLERKPDWHGKGKAQSKKTR